MVIGEWSNMAVTVSSRILRALLEQATVNATSLRLLAAIARELDPESKNETFETLLNDLVGDSARLLDMLERASIMLEEEQNG